MAIEKCTCKDNEQLIQLKVSIKRIGKNIEVTVKAPRHNETEIVVPKGTSSKVFSRTFEQLEALGEGEHELCNCHQISVADSVFRPKK